MLGKCEEDSCGNRLKPRCGKPSPPFRLFFEKLLLRVARGRENRFLRFCLGTAAQVRMPIRFGVAHRFLRP